MPKYSKKTIWMLKAYNAVSVFHFRSQDTVSERAIELLESYNQMRTEFVINQNWPVHESGVDIDVYDRFVKSYYVIAEHDTRAIAGLRATPVMSLEKSLSYTMWQNAVEYNSFVKQMNDYRSVTVSEQYKKWDITRLITQNSVGHIPDPYERVVSRIGMFKVLAVAAMVTDIGDKSIWYFTVTEKLYTFMIATGFNPQLIARGKISHSDENDSYLCEAIPHEVITSLKRKNKLLYLIARHQMKQKRLIKIP